MSPVDSYLKKSGNTPYHVCYRVENIDNIIKTLRAEQFFLVSPPAVYELLDGIAAFMFSAETGLIELTQYKHYNDVNNII